MPTPTPRPSPSPSGASYDELNDQMKRAAMDGRIADALKYAEASLKVATGGDKQKALFNCALLSCQLGRLDAAKRYYGRLTDERLREKARKGCAGAGLDLPE